MLISSAMMQEYLHVRDILGVCTSLSKSISIFLFIFENNFAYPQASFYMWVSSFDCSLGETYDYVCTMQSLYAPTNYMKTIWWLSQQWQTHQLWQTFSQNAFCYLKYSLGDHCFLLLVSQIQYPLEVLFLVFENNFTCCTVNVSIDQKLPDMQ